MFQKQRSTLNTHTYIHAAIYLRTKHSLKCAITFCFNNIISNAFRQSKYSADEEKKFVVCSVVPRYGREIMSK